MRASTSFSEEKEAKRLLLIWTMGVGYFNAHGPASKKVLGGGAQPLFSKSGWFYTVRRHDHW
jgi:hypothetical protein